MNTTPTGILTTRDDDCGGCIDEDCAIPETCGYHSIERLREYLAERQQKIEQLQLEVKTAAADQRERIELGVLALREKANPARDEVADSYRNALRDVRRVIEASA